MCSKPERLFSDLTYAFHKGVLAEPIGTILTVLFIFFQFVFQAALYAIAVGGARERGRLLPPAPFVFARKRKRNKFRYILRRVLFILVMVDTHLRSIGAHGLGRRLRESRGLPPSAQDQVYKHYAEMGVETMETHLLTIAWAVFWRGLRLGVSLGRWSLVTTVLRKLLEGLSSMGMSAKLGVQILEATVGFVWSVVGSYVIYALIDYITGFDVLVEDKDIIAGLDTSQMDKDTLWMETQKYYPFAGSDGEVHLD